jgi:ribonuclease J
MATVEFWGGVGVIGSSKVLIRDGDHRVLLDLGLDIPNGADLFRAPAYPRAGRELADRLGVGLAPRIPGLFDPSALNPGDPLGEAAEPTALFVTHAHIDHSGLAGFIREDIPSFASPDTIRILTALTAAGDGLPGGDPDFQPVDEDQAYTFGPIAVERVAVDHDVPGASGYIVTTSSGTLAFTGDLRFHGPHPERSWRFAERAAGCDILVTEGTALGLEIPPGPTRTEADVVADFARALEDAAGNLVLMAVYQRDVERVSEFVEVAKASGRTIVWPDRVATFLYGVGVESAVSFDSVGLDGLRADPGAYVYQPDVADPANLPALADLPIGPKTVWLHANGEPLGPFESRWSLFTEWLDALSVPLLRIGGFGHATSDDLHEFVHRVQPAILFPIHTFSPELLHPVGRTRRVTAEYARRYAFTGRAYGPDH